MTGFLDQARHLLRASQGGEVPRIDSPPAAAAWQGIGWWLAVLEQLRTEFPDRKFEAVLDCGTAPGLALAALRAGVPLVRLEASPETRRAVAAIAAALGGTLI